MGDRDITVGGQSVSSSNPLPVALDVDNVTINVAEANLAALGNTTDAEQTDPTQTASLISVAKGILAKLAGSLAVTGAFWQATQPVSAAALPLPTGAAIEAGGNLALVAATAGATSGAAVTTDANGTIQQYLRGLVKLIAAGVALAASAAAGGVASTFRMLSSAASTNATSVKVSAGRVYQVLGYNASSGVRYLKLYNKASAPTVGTDTPVKTIPAPPGQAFVIDNGDIGYFFSAGIAFAWTAAPADADTTALGAGDIVAFNMDYA